MRKILGLLGERLSYILFAGVLFTGLLIGFSIGYDSGHNEAMDKALKAEMGLYKDFVKTASKGGVFSFWGVKLLALDFKRSYEKRAWRNTPRVGGYEAERKYRQFSGIEPLEIK